jgi:hypothetical protein
MMTPLTEAQQWALQREYVRFWVAPSQVDANMVQRLIDYGYIPWWKVYLRQLMEYF